MGIDKVRFRKLVIPGDQLRFELTMKKRRGPVCQMSGKAFVDRCAACIVLPDRTKVNCMGKGVLKGDSEDATLEVGACACSSI